MLLPVVASASVVDAAFAGGSIFAEAGSGGAATNSVENDFADFDDLGDPVSVSGTVLDGAFDNDSDPAVGVNANSAANLNGALSTGLVGSVFTSTFTGYTPGTPSPVASASSDGLTAFQFTVNVDFDVSLTGDLVINSGALSNFTPDESAEIWFGTGTLSFDPVNETITLNEDVAVATFSSDSSTVSSSVTPFSFIDTLPAGSYLLYASTESSADAVNGGQQVDQFAIEDAGDASVMFDLVVTPIPSPGVGLTGLVMIAFTALRRRN
ncbi:MAG: hypothetical protein AAF743_03570 [Planctomycetota bacterium]